MTRKEGVLAHTLQKLDPSGKVLNPEREETDDEVGGGCNPRVCALRVTALPVCDM